MNIVTFNDIFEKPIIDRCSKKVWDQWKVSPLYDYALEIEKALEEEKKLATTELPPIPYEMFRAHYSVHYSEDSDGSRIDRIVDIDCFVRLLENKEWEIIFYPRSTAKRVAKDRTVMMGGIQTQYNSRELIIDLCDPEGKMWIDLDNLKHRVVSVDLITGKEELMGYQWEKFKDGQRVASYQVFCVLVAFAFDSMSLAVHTATVSPAKEHKSLDWVKARTHYTLIHHGHPANQREIAEGANVAIDRREQLKRMAHSRRAHYRTLKSDRFRYTKGRKIFVRATWVGPKEWKEEGGKQIYRILEPVV